MAYSSPPRNIDQLIKGRNAALKLKHGSPKFRDVLRERCRSRVKENREKFVNLLRSPKGSNDLNRVLSDTIRDELMSFSTIVEKAKGRNFEITNGVMIDRELQIFEECSHDLAQELDVEVEQIMLNCDALLSAENNIIEALLENECVDLIDCPICEKGNIVLSDSEISCTNCNVIIRAKTSLYALNNKIHSGVNLHSQICSNKPVFVFTDSSLKLICKQCIFYQDIIK